MPDIIFPVAVLVLTACCFRDSACHMRVRIMIEPSASVLASLLSWVGTALACRSSGVALVGMFPLLLSLFLVPEIVGV